MLKENGFARTRLAGKQNHFAMVQLEANVDQRRFVIEAECDVLKLNGISRSAVCYWRSHRLLAPILG